MKTRGQEKAADSLDAAKASRVSLLKGRRALVVGGSGGIGAAFARGLAARGASVLVHGRSPAKVEAAVAALRRSGGEAAGLVFDIEAPGPFIAALAGQSFDILVAAFGPFVQKPFAAHSPADWEKMALFNLALPGALAARFFPAMSGRGFGRMVFLGGTRTDVIRGFKSNAAYAAAKTGLGVLAKSIAAEGAAHNVAAIVVCPGLVRTEYLSAAQIAAYQKTAPGGKLLEPDDLARTALDLIDCDPCPASGAVVSLDAGLSF